MSTRDEILANFQVGVKVSESFKYRFFQAFTGMEDIGTCIGILESHNWDLLVRELGES